MLIKLSKRILVLILLSITFILLVAAVERGSSGTCFITFAVNTDGSVSNILILKGVSGCPECDLEAFKVIKMMPKWTPGRNKGETVRVQINLPIRFTLQ